MPVPSPRNSIRIARGNIADLNTNSTAFGEGEILYAIDQDRFYTSVSGSLVPVGAGVLNTESIDALADVDTTTVPPGTGQVLKWNGTSWAPADDASAGAVTSVAGKTGDVTLVKADITNFSDADYATAAQGTLAASALQPSSIGTTVQGYDADTTKNDTTNSFTALQTFTAGIDNNGAGYRSGITSMGALDINCSLGNYFTKTINGNSTFTVSNVPSSRAFAFTLELTHTSGTVTWFSGVQWPGGTTPTLTTGKVHLFTFITDDGGTSWRGSSQINYAS